MKRIVCTVLVMSAVVMSGFAGTGEANFPSNQTIKVAREIQVVPRVNIRWSSFGDVSTWDFRYRVVPLDVDGNRTVLKNKGEFASSYYASINGTNIVTAIEALGIANGEAALKKLMTALADAALVQYKKDNDIAE